MAGPTMFFGRRGQAGGLSCCSVRGSEMASPCTDPSPASTLCPAQGTTPGPFPEWGDEGTSLPWGTVCWRPAWRGVTGWPAFHSRALEERSECLKARVLRRVWGEGELRSRPRPGSLLGGPTP